MDVEGVVKGMSEAQRQALLTGQWNNSQHGFRELRIIEPCSHRNCYMVQLSSTGLAVRDHLLKHPD
jgi:hypothetical protein